MTTPCVMLVAAEPSGDSLGAGLAAALKVRLGGAVRLVGVGGPLMSAEGVQSPFEISGLSVMGVFEALKAYPLVLRRAREAARIAGRERPDVAVLIDSWGFNLRVARQLRRVRPGLFIFKYVGPQVWATRPGRARTLARAVDHLLTIHTFDAPFFEREGLGVTFVGNPALAKNIAHADPARLRAAIGAAPDDPILLVAPGSRRGEIDRMLPPFEAAVALLKSRRPGLRVVVIAADQVAPIVAAQVAAWPHEAHVVTGEAARLDAMRAATVALACSGTVTTELAQCGAPMVVAYRLGVLTYAIVQRLLRTRYITLLNVAAQRFVAPEMLQGNCNAEALAREIGLRLDDPGLRARQARDQTAALEIMRGGVEDPFAAAAEAVARRLPPSDGIAPAGQMASLAPHRPVGRRQERRE